MDSLKDKSSLKIGLDIDDTIFSFVEILIKSLNKKTNKNIKIEDVQTYDILSLFDIKLNQLKEIIQNEDLYSKGSIHKSSLEIINKLLDSNNSIEFITSRFKYDEYNTPLKTKQWLKKYGITCPVNYSNQKGLLCNEKKIDIFVDDGLHNILDIQKHSKETIVYLINKPWNSETEIERLKIGENILSKIRRIDCLTEVLDDIK